MHFYEEHDFFTELDDDVDAGELPTGCYMIEPYRFEPEACYCHSWDLPAIMLPHAFRILAHIASWHLVQFQARNVEKVITVTPCFTLVYIVYDGRTDTFRQNGQNLQEFTQICT